MPKRLKFAYKEDQIGLMYLAMKGRKRCAAGSCKRWNLLTAERCSACGSTQFDMRKEAPKQRQKLLRSVFYRNYLILRLAALYGFRRAEIVGQNPKDVYCRCVRCRAWRLQKQGKTPEQIADRIKKGLMETKFKLDEASKYGEHVLKPLPGMRPDQFKFNVGTTTVEEEVDGETVRQTVPYGTLLVYGKGYAKGRSEVKELRILDPVRTEIQEYIEANNLKGDDKLFSIKGRQCANIVKQAAVVAGTPHAEAMAPHGLRRSFGTIAWRKMKARGRADPLTLKELMRHADVKTSFIYTQADADEIQDAQAELLRQRTDQDDVTQKPKNRPRDVNLAGLAREARTHA